MAPLGLRAGCELLTLLRLGISKQPMRLFDLILSLRACANGLEPIVPIVTSFVQSLAGAPAMSEGVICFATIPRTNVYIMIIAEGQLIV